MGKFMSALVLQAGESREWILCEPFSYMTGAGEIITVPVGFITDLASIPAPFRNIFAVNGLHRRAAVIHDHLYSIKNKKRIDADNIFNEAMGVCGVPTIKRWLMYRAVRLFGWMA